MSEVKNENSECPICGLNLENHNGAQLIQCAINELSKINTKKTIFEQQSHTLCSNTMSSRKGGPVYE